MSEQKQLSLEELTSRKVELESKSKATGLTEAEKGELVDLSLKIVEVEDELEVAEAAKAKAPTKKPAPKAGAPAPEAPEVKKAEAYTPKDEEKHLFHVELTKGQRYDPSTGKQIAFPYVQMFDRTAWNQFKQHQAVLGYESKVLWEPTQKA